MEIQYGFMPTSYGLGLVGMINDSVCWMSFVDEDKQTEGMALMTKRFAGALFVADTQKVASIATEIFKPSPAVHTMTRGTPFQLKVWKALQEIPFGSTVSYSQVAQMIGHPTAVRAAASAVAHNPISVLIPCHRVITKNGKIHQYAYGTERKKALIDYERHTLKHLL